MTIKPLQLAIWGLPTALLVGVGLAWATLRFEKHIREDQQRVDVAAFKAILEKHQLDGQRIELADQMLAPGTRTMLGDDGEYHGNPSTAR